MRYIRNVRVVSYDVRVVRVRCVLVQHIRRKITYNIEMVILLFFWARPGPLVQFLGPARYYKIIFMPLWARKYKSFKNTGIQSIFLVKPHMIRSVARTFVK